MFREEPVPPEVAMEEKASRYESLETDIDTLIQALSERITDITLPSELTAIINDIRVLVGEKIEESIADDTNDVRKKEVGLDAVSYAQSKIDLLQQEQLQLLDDKMITTPEGFIDRATNIADLVKIFKLAKQAGKQESVYKLVRDSVYTLVDQYEVSLRATADKDERSSLFKKYSKDLEALDRDTLFTTSDKNAFFQRLLKINNGS